MKFCIHENKTATALASRHGNPAKFSLYDESSKDRYLLWVISRFIFRKSEFQLNPFGGTQLKWIQFKLHNYRSVGGDHAHP